MNIHIPSHVHSPNPAWIPHLENKRVFLDVGIALRAALFPESYCRKILEHIERTKKGAAVISPHILDEGLRVLSKALPTAQPAFRAYIKNLRYRKVIEQVPNGNPKSMHDWKTLGLDDDIVMASAVQSGCDSLITLDEPLAKQAATKLQVLTACELEWSQMLMVRDNPDSPGAAILPQFFFAPDSGTFVLQLQPSPGTTGYINKGGRRYVFATDQGFACWLSEETWKYEFGYVDSQGAIATIPLMAREQKVRVGVTYNLATRECTVGAAVDGQAPETKYIKKQSLLRKSIGSNIQLLGSPKGQEYSGFWQGSLSTAKHHGLASFRFAIHHGSFFCPLDHFRYRIEDALFGKNQLIIPETKLIS